MAGLLVLDVTEALGWEVGAAAFLCCELELFELGFPVGKKATQNMSEILSFTESEARARILILLLKCLHDISRPPKPCSGNLFGLSGLVPDVAPSPLLGLLELAMEKTPESA